MQTYRFYTFFMVIVFFTTSYVAEAKDSYPNTISVQPASDSYCQNDAATALSVTTTSVTCGAGGTTVISRTFTWYETSTSCTGGSVVQTTTNTSTSNSYTPPTGTLGTLYYYCVISWGAGTCAPSGSLTSSCATITVVEAPTTSNAGPDSTLAACATTYTLAGNTPAVGSGTWTCTTNCTGVSITTPTDPASGVTGLTPGTATTFTWTISNSPCPNSTDAVIITAVVGAGCWSYCTPNYSLGEEPICRVVFETIDNNSSCTDDASKYEDYTAMSASVTQGQTYSITVYGTTEGNFKDSINVFIDMNNNGTFDAGEEFKIGVINNCVGCSVTGTVTIDAGAVLGNTVMRVMKKYNAYSTACNTAGYGEAEDYTLNIISSCTTPTTHSSSMTFSNVTSLRMTVSWTSGNGSGRIVVAKQGSAVDWAPTDNNSYGANSSFGSGTELGTGNYVIYNNTGNTVPVTNLTATTTYYFKVFEYNVCSGDTLYYTGGTPLTGNQATISPTTSSWSMGAAATYIKTNSTTSSWQARYDGGASTITASGFWILRKTGAANPGGLVSNGGYYPNLTIESDNGAWTTATVDSSTFTGSSGFPTVKGIFNIGGTGTGTVTFLNENTNATLTLVQSNLVVQTGSTLQNYGTGFEIQGNLTVSGSLVDDADDGRKLKFSGATAQSISGSGTLEISALEIDKSSNSLTLSRSITIDDTLKLTNGIINSTATDSLALSEPCIVNPTRGSATSYVSYYISRTINTSGKVYEYPIGHAAPNRWRPIGITGKDATSRVYSIEYKNVNPNTDKGSTTLTTDSIRYMNTLYYFDIKRYPSSGYIGLKMWYEDADLDPLTGTESQVMIGHWDASNSWWDSWDLDYESVWTIDSVVNWIAADSAHTFSGAGPGKGSPPLGPLPVSLLYFDAKYNDANKYVDLRWATTSEQNNKYFQVEKSKDVVDFVTVVTVAGAGNSNTLLSYSDIDYFPWNGIAYYRLKQVDYDGLFSYSKLVKVDVPIPYSFNVYPNPSDGDDLRIKISGIKDDEVLVVVKDILGVTQYSKVVILQNDIVTLAIDPENTLAAGVYFVIASSNDDLYMKKIVVK